MIIEIFLSGFLFLFIIIVLFISGRFGHETLSDLNSENKLKKIYNNPKNFKISISLELVEHISILTLAITLFIAFSHYNIILGIIWLVSRIGEGLIQIYNKKEYSGLLNLAITYPNSEEDEKQAKIDFAHTILKKKNSSFVYSQILFFIGTLAYSSLFVIYGILPIVIGWFGIITSIIYGIGNIIFLLNNKSKIVWSLGGLLILLFEITLGVSLIIYSNFIT